ncbi:MAG: hypothetical protein LBD18_00285 [Treponema sp.]|nr:hypothetical protein [Treponema sp.]
MSIPLQALLTTPTPSITVPTGIYDNDGDRQKAIMLADVRNTQTGESTLLAPGVILPVNTAQAVMPP